MQKLVLTLLVASLGLAACGGSNNGNAPTTTAPEAAMPTAVTGTVGLKTPAQLSPAAQLKLALVNVSMNPKVVVAQTTTPISTMPAGFQLPFEANRIDRNAFYVLEASVVDGERRYIAPREFPVLTKGSAAKIDIQLTPEPTASEKVEAEYNQLQGSIGNMKTVRGASEDEASTMAWDGFFDAKGLRFIREVVDFGDKGRTRTYFAYRVDGKPLAVVVERVPALAERPNAVSRAGWDESGALVWRTKREGSTQSDLPEADAAALLTRAKARHDDVAKRKP